MFKSLINLFFPNICHACLNALEDNQDTICTSCRHRLPVTNFHFNNDNTIGKVLYGRAKIEQGTALFRFEKQGPVQQLIHGLKYRGYEKIGFVLGNWLGGELKGIDSYKTIDVVIPVPIHKKKLRSRGYNQVSKFGQQIAKHLNAIYKEDVLLKITNSKSQVTKKRWARWQDSASLFTVTNLKSVADKHILLVDDIITTGATMEACIKLLTQNNNVKISIACMAIA
ncbi:ComF family protein [Aestuariivivens sediminis]|uniref:ComF family protein n=1 Tax=Aestuariivivens sediminis TaxID=2913557 RepID=UPI001F583FE1|nr:phosphoribosyltransferase family protein [Aestuariivivens sediminis]